MYILGISCYYHDSSAALLKDGRIVAAALEERFTRKKHDSSFPLNSIDCCLRSQRIRIDELDYIAFYEKPILKFERVLFQHLESFPRSLKAFISSMPSWVNEKLRIIRALRKIGYKKDVLFVEHHLAHAGAFLASPFSKAAIVIADGVGEWATTSIGFGKGNRIDIYKELAFPSSIGLLYSAITAYLGFRVNDSEYKVMGLSAYGSMDKKANQYYQKLMGLIDVKDDGSFQLDMDYFPYHHSEKMYSGSLCRILGPARKPKDSLEQRHMDIAAALQMVLEEIMGRIINHAFSITKCENVVIAGGVALNSIYNGKILKKTPFTKVWIPPDPGDGGASMGAALYAYNSILGNKRDYILKNACLGPSFSDSEIKAFLEWNGIKYAEFADDASIAKAAAKMIFEDKIVGWFQLGMEFGPRALGARSILANPRNPDMKGILNRKVKRREEFRPFAPSVCIENAAEYFICGSLPESAGFMLMVYPVRKKYQKLMPAAVHVDGSGRLHAVKKSQNPLYYRVIREFGKLSGINAVINTSFNVNSEPIVCSPYDAYRCMMGTDIDCIFMGKYLIKREDNLKDAWDSARQKIDKLY